MLVLTLNSAWLWAQTKDVHEFPIYHREQRITGVIRIWGHGSRQDDFVGSLLRAWEVGFRRYQPNIQFENELWGNNSAMGGIYTGAADLALMSREIWPTENDGFEQALGHKPFTISVMTGSVDVRDHSAALVIFVHRDNPLGQLSLAQVDAAFGADHRRGNRNFRTWGDLGLVGEWVDKPIHLYGFAIAHDSAQFFEQAALAGSEKWNCELRQFADLHDGRGIRSDAGQRILDALARDKYGMALSSLAYRNAATKPVALASAAGGRYYRASRDGVITRSYPLTRAISMVLNREPEKPIDPKLKEFLSFILSAEGQSVVAADGGYLQLTPEIATQERGKLE